VAFEIERPRIGHPRCSRPSALGHARLGAGAQLLSGGANGVKPLLCFAVQAVFQHAHES
jgi:hypothetical protein